MKKFLRKNNLLILWIILILIFVVILNIFFYREILHSIFSIVTLISSVIYYFKAIFKINVANPLPYMLFDYINDFKTGNIVTPPFVTDITPLLPNSSSNLVLYFKNSWFMFWNINYFKNSFNIVGNIVGYSNIVFLLLVIVILFKVVLSINLNNPCDVTKTGFTRSYKTLEILNKKFYRFIKIPIMNFVKYGYDHKLIKILLTFIFYYLGFVNIAIDLFCYLLVLLSNFNLEIIYKALYSTVYSIAPILYAIPLQLYPILIYLIIDKIRYKKALKKLMVLDYKNRDFIESNTGVCNIVKGAPGVGKTLLLTDLGRTTEQIFRYNLLEILNKYRNYFPNFDFKNYEEYIKYLKLNNIINNHSQLEDLLDDRIKRFKNLFINCLVDLENLKRYLFNYDFTIYPLKYWNGSSWITFNDFLKTYGSAYFYYICDKPLIYSNYSIRFDSSITNSDFFPVWNYDYFTIDKNTIDIRTKYSHILDMDTLRLGKKFNPNSTVIGFGVVCFTEFDKERGNQLSNIKYKKDDQNPNPINDELTKYLKLSRQVATIDYKPFFKLFTDLQRTGDLSLSNVEISECIIKIKEKEQKSTLKLFCLEPLICNLFINLLNRFVVMYRSTRNYYSLIFKVINFLLIPFQRYKERRENLFGYSKLKLEISTGDDASDTKECFYYLLNKKAYAKAYSTDTHYGFFKLSLNKEKTSIDCKPVYSSLRATSEEIKLQHSYLGEDLDKSFNRKDIEGDIKL